MTQRIMPYEVLKSYENIPQLEKYFSAVGKKYFSNWRKIFSQLWEICHESDTKKRCPRRITAARAKRSL